MDCGENEIAIAIHFDAGRILTKSGSRAQIGICVFWDNRLRNNPKMLSFANVSAYLALVIKVRELQLLLTRGDTSSVLWIRHGRDVERPISRTIVWEYWGINTDVCETR